MQVATTPETMATLVSSDLTAMRAARLSDLVPGAPDRALLPGTPTALEHTDGRTFLVPVVIEPGPPAALPVPTELALRFVITSAHDGAARVTSRPDRADLATAAALAVGGEARALEAAAAALDRARIRPPGSSWAGALRSARLDPQLPAAQFAGTASWSMLFEPWSQEHGWNGVVLDARSFAVQLVNGRPPE